MENKDKVAALYRYIKELAALKYSLVTNVDKQLWTCFLKDIPDDPANITLHYRDRVEEESTADNCLLEVHKPEFQQCPPPPEAIREWLVDGWDVFANNAERIESKEFEKNKEIQVERFDAVLERVLAFEVWQDARNAWAERQKRIYQTRKFFTRLYHLYIDLDKDSESIELMVGEGILRDNKNAAINHPLILKRIQLDFVADANTIHINDTESEPELYASLLQEMDEVNRSVVKSLMDELYDNFYHPLDRNETPDFLKILIHRLSAHSKFIDSQAALEVKSDDRLLLTLNPVFFVRKRMDGSLKAIDEIIKTIEQTGYVPGHLYDIACAGKVDIAINEHEPTLEEQLASAGGESADILLAKPANREQLEIAQQIERYNAVVVQGPPGTGKTHTIANLLGHFLAQGKSVLVTSHTKQALAVLKEKVPAGIQNLCVSVLDDTNSDMERSVDGISDYLSKYNSHETKKKMEAARRGRSEIIEKLTATRKQLFTIKYKEFQPIVYNGDSYSPVEAADFVNKNAERLSYIPGNVVLYQPLPLTISELTALYRTNTEIAAEEETELNVGLPNPEELLSPIDFEALNQIAAKHSLELKSIETQMQAAITFDYIHDCVVLTRGSTTMNLAVQPRLNELNNLARYLGTFKEIGDWMVAAAVDGNKGGGYKKRWEIMIDAIEDSAACASDLVSDMLGKTILFDPTADLTRIKTSLDALNELLQKKQKWSQLDLFLHRKIKPALDFVKINDQPISSLDECITSQKYLALIEKRSTTATYWDELMGTRNVPCFSTLGEEPELICQQQIPNIKRCLTWHQVDYGKLLQLISSAGLNADLIFATSDFDSELVKTQKALRAITDVIPTHIKLAKMFLELQDAATKIAQCSNLLTQDNRMQSTACSAMSNALRERNMDSYVDNFAKLSTLYKKYAVQLERQTLLSKVEPVAFEWANHIRQRMGIHGQTLVPEDIVAAWKWKQFAGIIDDLTAAPYQELQYKAASLSKELRQQTAVMAEHAAWYYLLQRAEVDLDMRQALQGWKITVRRIGKGTGKNAPVLKSKARKLMAQCQLAVPAWIMPVNKALESLNPSRNQFDIVIIDEASQSDITALAIAYMAKKIIVVGDDKQVSPMAVGVNVDKINALMELYIKDVIPNWHLYDSKASLYDIAGTTFQPLMLCEHFRCVPEIIGYSNQLSYDYKIKPLRDTSRCVITPAVVNYRVNDGKRDGQRKINVREAETIAALMQACIEQEEYAGASFGAISLLGNEQAAQIQQVILEQLPPTVIQERHILCGNASHFQGDERNVIFLSVVDSSEQDGPLTLAGEGPEQSRKQRYNVAASRAQDQMWVVHSLDITRDLKHGDIRRDLLEYAAQPKAHLNLVTAIEQKAESPFEASVAKSLTAAGYHLAQQWEVGAYRIDMVALYNGEQVAIECDGDRYHSGQEKIREDMERQTILERLGWRFIRIRGSEYYRNPDATIKRVINELEAFGIHTEATLNTSSEETTEYELLERVKLRAAQILNEWHKNKDAEDGDSELLLDMEQAVGACESLASTRDTASTATLVEPTATVVASGAIDRPVIARTVNSNEKHPVNTYNQGESMVQMLQREQVEFLDRREKSGIIWIYHVPVLKDKLEQYCRENAITLVLEKRGATATMNKPAWRAMVK